MTPAELKTLRERLALSDADAARLAGVQPRSYRYWESGGRSVPEDVAEKLKQLNAVVQHAVNQAVETADMLSVKHGMPEAIDLVRYSTPEDQRKTGQPIVGVPDFLQFKIHIAIIRRTCDALERAGYTVSIELL